MVLRRESLLLPLGSFIYNKHDFKELICLIKNRRNIRAPTCADLESFYGEGPTLITFCFVLFFSFFSLWDGVRIKMPVKVGHHWPASEMQLNCV